jgi:hypothetical protein
METYSLIRYLFHNRRGRSEFFTFTIPVSILSIRIRNLGSCFPQITEPEDEFLDVIRTKVVRFFPPCFSQSSLLIVRLWIMPKNLNKIKHSRIRFLLGFRYRMSNLHYNQFIHENNQSLHRSLK